METIQPPVKKPTSVISWLGFGISAFVFLLIWTINLLILSNIDHAPNGTGVMYATTILIGTLFGLFAIIFSIVGLVMAIKNGTAKWMSVTGIVLWLLSIVSAVMPIVIIKINSNNKKIEKSAQIKNQSSITTNNISIEMLYFGKIRCVNNTNADNSIIGNMDISDYGFEDQLSNWFEINNIDNASRITIETSEDTDYSDIKKLIETLDKLGYTEYKLTRKEG